MMDGFFFIRGHSDEVSKIFLNLRLFDNFQFYQKSTALRTTGRDHEKPHKNMYGRNPLHFLNM